MKNDVSIMTQKGTACDHAECFAWDMSAWFFSTVALHEEKLMDIERVVEEDTAVNLLK